MAYTGSISSQFFRLQQRQRERFKVTRLEHYLDDISFFNFFSTRSAIDSERALLVDLGVLGLRADQAGVQECCRKLQRTRLLFYVSNTGTGATLVIEFPTVYAAVALDACLAVYPAASFPGAFCLYQTAAAPQVHHRVQQQHQQLADNVSERETAAAAPRSVVPLSAAAPAFVPPVLRRTAGPKQCPFGMHCDRNIDCTMMHTAEQMRLFKLYKAKNSNMNFRQWKSALCTHPDDHPASDCSFSHGPGDEQWCPRCRASDHLLLQCTNRKQSPATAVWKGS
jgi:hypothetical protein